jgi:hypothetical protein
VALPAYAVGPKVSVGGFIDFQAGISDQDVDTDVRNLKFQNDTEVHVSVSGKADNGIGYGAVVELESDGEGLNADKIYIYLEGDFYDFVSTLPAGGFAEFSLFRPDLPAAFYIAYISSA